MAMMKSSDITTFTGSQYIEGFELAVFMSVGSPNTTEWARFMAKVSGDNYKMKLYNCVKATTGSGTTDNTKLIPIKIVGIN